MMAPASEIWPALPFAKWQDTYATLHLWTQIVGKTRLALAPMVNHWWNVTLYVTARGLSTAVVPHRQRAFEVEFDFLDHVLVENERRRHAHAPARRAPGRGLLCRISRRGRSAR